MKKTLILSIITATIIGTNLNAQNMYGKILSMEAQINTLKKELIILQGKDLNNVKRGHNSNNTDKGEEEEEEVFDDETTMEDIEESISELNRATGGNHLKFTVDYRFAIDNLQYTMADNSTAKNDAFLTNRLLINMGYKATNNLTFKGQLAYNKAFGYREGTAQAFDSWETIDWVASENPYNDQLRVRSAYFLWQDLNFFGLDIPWTFSIGRRPSTGGNLANLREDDHATSPTGHLINVEFDGLSSKFTLNKDTGTSVKFCIGRGMSNAAPKFSSTPYAEVDSENSAINISGFIFVPYDNKQYKLSIMYYYAANLIDAHIDAGNPDGTFDTVGGLHAANAYISLNGIGTEVNDFLDETIFFMSASMSKTDPNNKSANLVGNGMLGSADAETGYSYWVGTQFPSLLSEDGRWGLEYNYGSEYWRPITYGEDTNIGSKVAARGKAYEAYFTEYLVEDILSLQIRYTYIDYAYTGSNGFFGNSTGAPTKITSATVDGAGNPVVDKAQDIRFYLRYKY